MKFTEIALANIHRTPRGKKWEIRGSDLIEWVYDDCFTEERRSRAKWARALARLLSKATTCGNVEALDAIRDNLLLNAKVDEK